MSLASLIATLLEWLFGRWLNGRAQTAQPRAQAQQAKAEAEQATVRDGVDVKVQSDREHTDAEVDNAQRDAAGSDGLQRSNQDAAAAIAEANDRVR